MPKQRKFNLEDFQTSLLKSSTLREFMISLDLKPSGGNYANVRNFAEKNGIELAFECRKGFQQGHEPFVRQPIPLEEILKEKTVYQSYKLKNRLLQSGMKSHICENCNSAQWLNYPIPLELHHINGNNTDNRIENLRLLCPNCHALTPNYRGKNKIIV